MTNEAKPAADVELFYKEAKKRGVYTQAQESLIGTWRTLSTSVLPGLNVDLSKVTVGELKEKLPTLLATYGAKSDVKANTIQTYNIKGQRLLADFIQYNGAADTAWFAWKQKQEKKQQQTSAAASARFNKQKAPQDSKTPKDASELGGENSVNRHPLKLPNNRSAELVVPSDLKSGDVAAMQKQFSALMAYLQAQIDAEVMEEE